MTNDDLRESNLSLFTWCLYLLDGAQRRVDIEEIYVKCFEISPSRFSWRTRSDLPDAKKLSKALVDAESKTDFIIKFDVHTRGLSAAGLSWIERYLPKLRHLYGGGMVPPGKSNVHRKLAQSLRAHPIWDDFKSGNTDASIFSLSDALHCSPGSPNLVWKSRFEEILIAANVLADPELETFAIFAADVYSRFRR